MADKEFDVKVKITSDAEGGKAAGDSLDRINKSSKGLETSTATATKHINAMQGAMTSFASSARGIATVSAIIGGPLIAATKNYVSTIGMAESTSRAWLGTTYQLEQSYIRLGRVGAKVALPWAKQAAGLAEQGAAWAEKNPGAVEGGLEVAAAGIGLAGIAKASGAVTSALGPFGVALVAATAGLVALVNSDFGKKGITAGKQLNTLIETGIGLGVDQFMSIITGKPINDKFLNQALARGGVSAGSNVDIHGGKGGAKKQASKGFDLNNIDDPENFITTSLLQKMRQRQIQERYVQEDIDRQKFVMQRDFNRQWGYSEQDFYRQRARSLRDFSIQQQYSEQMFYRQRAIALRDFQISVGRNDYDYQLSRKRAAEDHNFSLKQIMLSGDALQYYYSQRQYNIDKQRAEEDYQLSKKRAKEDFNRSRSDSDAQFQIERDHNARMFAIQLQDSWIDFTIQRQRTQEQYDIQLGDLDFQYKREAARRLESFTESILPEIRTENQYRLLMQRSLTNEMINQFNSVMNGFAGSWNGFITQLNNNQNGGPNWNYQVNQRASGGYVNKGMYQLHDNEFVLSASTTKAAESVAKSNNLTQDSIISMLTGGNGGMVYNDNREFSRGITLDEKIMLRNELRQMVVEGFAK